MARTHSLRKFMGTVPLERALQYRGSRLGRRVIVQSVSEAKKEEAHYKGVIRGLRRRFEGKEKAFEKRHPESRRISNQRKRLAEIQNQIRFLAALENVGRKPHAQELAVSMMLNAGLSEKQLRPLLNSIYQIEYQSQGRSHRGSITGPLSAVQDNWLQQIEQTLHAKRQALGPKEIRRAVGVTPKQFSKWSAQEQNRIRSRQTTALGLLDLAKLATKLPVRSGTSSFPYIHKEYRQSPATLQAAHENVDYLILKDLAENGPALRSELMDPTSFRVGPRKKMGARLKIHPSTLTFFVDNAIANGLLEVRTIAQGARKFEQLAATKECQQWIAESEAKGFLVEPLRRRLVGEKKADLPHSNILVLQSIKETWRALDFWLQHPELRPVEKEKLFGNPQRLRRVVYRKTRAWRNLSPQKVERLLEIWKKQSRSASEKKSISRLEQYLKQHPEELHS